MFSAGERGLLRYGRDLCPQKKALSSCPFTPHHTTSAGGAAHPPSLGNITRGHLPGASLQTLVLLLFLSPSVLLPPLQGLQVCWHPWLVNAHWHWADRACEQSEDNVTVSCFTLQILVGNSEWYFMILIWQTRPCAKPALCLWAHPLFSEVIFAVYGVCCRMVTPIRAWSSWRPKSG